MPWPSLSAVLDLAVPVRCAVCRNAEAPVCRACAGRVRLARFSPRPRHVVPQPCPAGLPPTWAAARLDDPLRGVITGYKDHGRRDLAPGLAALLACAVAEAAPMRSTGLILVPVPTRTAARRRRGDAPMTALAAAAVVLLDRRDVLVADALVPVRASQDQARLTRAERARNLAGAWDVAPRWRAVLTGRSIVIVDDIVTSGATLVEASRALCDSGVVGSVLPAAAVVAATPRTPRSTAHVLDRRRC